MSNSFLVDGYIYVPDDSDEPQAHVESGKTVSVQGRGPPWIVVDHDISSIIISRWPGRLWQAQIVEAATEEDQASNGGSPLPYAKYTRAIAVAIGSELPVWTLFGSDGEHILPIIEAASNLTLAQASILAVARSPDSPKANHRVWERWLESTRAIDGSSESSPVGYGLSVVYRQVYERAKFLEGDMAVIDDGEECCLAEPWSAAAGALIDAALARGAPRFASETDTEILTVGWRALTQGSPRT